MLTNENLVHDLESDLRQWNALDHSKPLMAEQVFLNLHAGTGEVVWILRVAVSDAGKAFYVAEVNGGFKCNSSYGAIYHSSILLIHEEEANKIIRGGDGSTPVTSRGRMGKFGVNYEIVRTEGDGWYNHPVEIIPKS